MITKTIQYLLHLFFLISRPLTIGVRGICYDEKSNSVLLVRHTYSNGWVLPGGGTGKNESTRTALRRELTEEVGLICNDIQIFDIYFNQTVSKRDHVVTYLVNSWTEKKIYERPKLEIAGTNWCKLNELPHDLAPCSRNALNKFKDNLYK